MSSSHRPFVGLRYNVPRQRPGWELVEGMMPESVLHDQIAEVLKSILVEWAVKRGATFIGRNLAVRWDQEHPRVGIDPDVSVHAPPPPDVVDIRSVRTWLEGHEPPQLAIEVVSNTNPRKDYAIGPDKYAASGTGESWVFDPLLCGPTAYGGPYRLQVWTRSSDGDFARIYAGDGPARSPYLGAWIVPTNEGRRLRITDDEAATSFWLTREESERAAKESERAAKEAALARVAELEAQMKQR